MRTTLSFAVAFSLAIALSGCGGGGGNALPSQPAKPTVSSKQHVTLEIDVPKESGSSNKRHPQYISPATTQMAIDVQQNGSSIAGFPQTVALTPTSNGCRKS